LPRLILRAIRDTGLSYTFPNVAAGTNDNTVAEGQIITTSGSGTLRFLVSASYGPAAQLSEFEVFP
jgi:hypothetical protein